MEIFLFYQRASKEISSSILMSRSKNVASVPLCFSFSYNSPGYMHLKDSEKSPSLFIGQRQSKNPLVAWYLYAVVDKL